MNEFKANAAVTDEELIGVLTAISVVSKRLAGKLIRLSRSSQSTMWCLYCPALCITHSMRAVEGAVFLHDIIP